MFGTSRLIPIAFGLLTFVACSGTNVASDERGLPPPKGPTGDLSIVELDELIGLPVEVAVQWAEDSGWEEIRLLEAGSFHDLAISSHRISLQIEDDVVVEAWTG